MTRALLGHMRTSEASHFTFKADFISSIGDGFSKTSREDGNGDAVETTTGM